MSRIEKLEFQIQKIKAAEKKATALLERTLTDDEKIKSFDAIHRLALEFLESKLSSRSVPHPEEFQTSVLTACFGIDYHDWVYHLSD